MMIPNCFHMTSERSLTHSFNKCLLTAQPVPVTRDTNCTREAKQLTETIDAYNPLKVNTIL